MNPFQLRVEHLTKTYGTLAVWTDLSLTFTSGQAYCLMGPSGCGKTTLFKVLLGLEPADSGQIRLETADGGQIPVSGAHPPLVAVFQENRLCGDFSPLDNVLLAADGSLGRRDVYHELCRLLPEESVLRPAATLSGGMKRRVAIARALLAPSCGILMDEPFTGLDEGTKDTVIRYIKEKASGKLLVVATHQEEDVLALDGKLMRFPPV